MKNSLVYARNLQVEYCWMKCSNIIILFWAYCFCNKFKSRSVEGNTLLFLNYKRKNLSDLSVCLVETRCQAFQIYGNIHCWWDLVAIFLFDISYEIRKIQNRQYMFMAKSLAEETLLQDFSFNCKIKCMKYINTNKGKMFSVSHHIFSLSF